MEIASRPELRQICCELGIQDYEDLSIHEMYIVIRKAADKLFANKSKKMRSADVLSPTLKRFLTKEYDFAIKDKEGKKVKIV